MASFGQLMDNNEFVELLSEAPDAWKDLLVAFAKSKIEPRPPAPDSSPRICRSVTCMRIREMKLVVAVGTVTIDDFGRHQRHDHRKP